jgi:excisionase family DNA binding protein
VSKRKSEKKVDINAPWLDVQGVARLALVSAPTVIRAARSGRLVGFKIQNRRLWRFRPSDVDAWITSSATQIAVTR